MHYTPDEVAKLLANRPNQPHYIASLIAECVAAECERCARACEDSNTFDYDDPGGFFAALI